MSGSFLGSFGGHNCPLLSPSELPDQSFPSLVIPPTQITSFTEPGDDTSPSSSSPSFPAAAITYTPLSIAFSTAISRVSVVIIPPPKPCPPPRLNEIISASCATHQSTASAIPSSVPDPVESIALATNKSTFLDIPLSPPSATIIPAIAVP